MDLHQLKRLRADLGYVQSDPDAHLTHLQQFHLARAIRTVRDGIVRLQDEEERRMRMLGLRPGESLASIRAS